MTVLRCLDDPYLRSLRAGVVRCEETPAGFATVLSETLLYPEGGGQPSDGGRVDGLEIQGLYRDEEGDVVHLLPRAVSGTVAVEVDWPRRYDHMQQHTAQHLITAVAQDRFDLKTTAFHLGPVRSDIELDCPDLAPDLKTALEKEVNGHIRSNLPVTWRLADSADLDRAAVRTRGLPEGFSGRVRLVEIAGVDLNTCGGTHVAGTAELQSVKLLHTERLRGGTRLFFAAGGRVLLRMEEMLERERSLTRLLTCGPEEHAKGVERLAEAVRSLEKEGRSLRRELAVKTGEELARREAARKEDQAACHFPERDMAFLRTVAAAARAKRPELTVLLTAGDGPSGLFLLAGPEDRVEALGPKVAERLGGRGGGKGGSFQGKCSRPERCREALEGLSS